VIESSELQVILAGTPLNLPGILKSTSINYIFLTSHPIAEGNGKATDGDRRRYFEIARGSALECGAVQDVLQVCGALAADENTNRKALLDRIVAMLTKLGRRGYAVHENLAQYTADIDPDADSDPDTDGDHERTARQPLPGGDVQ